MECKYCGKQMILIERELSPESCIDTYECKCGFHLEKIKDYTIYNNGVDEIY